MAITHQLRLSQKFAKQGFQLVSHSSCVTWQIPSIMHVLYVMRLLEDEEITEELEWEYNCALGNGHCYGENLHLVAAACFFDVDTGCREEVEKGGTVYHPLNREKAKKVIAQAIIDLMARHAKCLFNRDFVDNCKIAGISLPDAQTRAEKLEACECPSCR